MTESRAKLVNIDLLDSQGVLISTAAIDDTLWNTQGRDIAAFANQKGLSVEAPGYDSPGLKVGNMAAAKTWIMQGAMQMGYEPPEMPKVKPNRMKVGMQKLPGAKGYR
jgi:hypothetical protein